MLKLTPELLIKAKQAESPEALVAFAKENDVMCSNGQAKLCI